MSSREITAFELITCWIIAQSLSHCSLLAHFGFGMPLSQPNIWPFQCLAGARDMEQAMVKKMHRLSHMYNGCTAPAHLPF